MILVFRQVFARVEAAVAVLHTEHRAAVCDAERAAARGVPRASRGRREDLPRHHRPPLLHRLPPHGVRQPAPDLRLRTLTR